MKAQVILSELQPWVNWTTTAEASKILDEFGKGDGKDGGVDAETGCFKNYTGRQAFGLVKEALLKNCVWDVKKP